MSARPKFELVIKGGDRVFAVDKPISFGTAPGSTVRLKSDGQIAPTHTVVEPRDGSLFVQATGVTLVNGDPVATAELSVGSVLRIGRLELVVRLASTRAEVVTQPEAQPDVTDRSPVLVPGTRPPIAKAAARPSGANPVMQASAPRASSANLAPVHASGAIPAAAPPARASGAIPAGRGSGAIPAAGAARPSSAKLAPVRASGAIPAAGAARPSSANLAPVRGSGAIPAAGAARPSSANLAPVRGSGAIPAAGAARPSSANLAPVRGSGAIPAAVPPARPSGAISALAAPAARGSGVKSPAQARPSGAISALAQPPARRGGASQPSLPAITPQALADEDDGGGRTVVRPSGRQSHAGEPLAPPVPFLGEDDPDGSSVEPTTMRPLPTAPLGPPVPFLGEDDLDGSSVEPTTMRPLPTAPPGPLQPGDVIAGRYEIAAHLADGGMGEVYRATHIELGRVFALKVMKYELSQDPEFVERFKREAVASSRIGQQNIVDISDFGRTEGGRFYFVMEFLDGPTLAQVIERERVLYASRAIGIVVQIARALAAAHEQGIVHRDLKPENVIILQRAGQKDFVKVVDFGVAKVADPSGKGAQTALGMVVGTPQYMSPEQASGVSVDARSDIYSLGLIAWELIAGRVVFEGDSLIELMMAQMRQPAPPLVSGLADSVVPPELSALIMRMLEKEREARPQTMLEVVEGFEQFLFGAFSGAPARVAPVEPVPVAPVVAAELLPAPGPAPRPRWPLFVGGAVALLLLAVLVAIIRPTTSPTPVKVEPVRPPAPVKVEPVRPPEPVKVVVPVEPVVQTIVLKVVTTPDKAEVFDDDIRIGTTPFEVKWPQGKLLKLRLAREGYLEEARSLSPAADLELNFALKRKPVAPRPKPKPVPDELGPSPY